MRCPTKKNYPIEKSGTTLNVDILIVDRQNVDKIADNVHYI
jgi:hypothetical protein